MYDSRYIRGPVHAFISIGSGARRAGNRCRWDWSSTGSRPADHSGLLGHAVTVRQERSQKTCVSYHEAGGQSRNAVQWSIPSFLVASTIDTVTKPVVARPADYNNYVFVPRVETVSLIRLRCHYPPPLTLPARRPLWCYRNTCSSSSYWYFDKTVLSFRNKEIHCESVSLLSLRY